MRANGKGDTPRPFSITPDEYRKRWEQIFRRDDGTKTGSETPDLKDQCTKQTRSALGVRPIAICGYYVLASPPFIEPR